MFRTRSRTEAIRCAALAAAIAAFAIGGAQVYRATRIGGPDLYTQGYAISANGNVAGVYGAPDGNLHAFLYSAGAIQDLGTLGGTESWAYGVNSAGEAVGYSYTTGNQANHAFLFAGGKLTDLGTLGGTYAAAYGVNAGGAVVGLSTTAGAAGGAFLYENGAMKSLGTLGGQGSGAFAINDSGQVAGDSNTPSGATHAFLYSGGAMQDLGLPAGSSSSYGRAINSQGDVAGYCDVASEHTHALLYSNGAIQDIGTLGGSQCMAFGVNSADVVVGDSYTSGDADDHAFVYSNGVMRDLNSLVDATGSGARLQFAYGINDSGAIIAYDNIAGQAIILTPYFFDAPTAYQIVAGKYVSGNLASLANADQNYLVVQSGPTFSNGSPPLSIVVTGTSTVAIPSDLRFKLDGHLNSVDIQQTIEMYDYVAGAWTVVATTAGATSDSTETAITASPARFVQAGTLQVKARLSWKPVGPISKSPWSAYIDQAVWNVSP